MLPIAENGKVLITGYYPNLALAIIGTIIFLALACAFLSNFFRYHRHRYTLWITLGTVLMTIGFAVRIIMHFGYNSTSIPIYTVTTLAILLSPCAFIAQDYYVLPKMAEWLERALQADAGSRYSGGTRGRNNISGDCLFLKPRLIGRIFLTSDVITFLLQLGGSGMAASADLAATGDKIALVGLAAQLITFSLFITLLAYFGFRVRSLYRAQWTMQSGLGWKNDWRAVYWATMWTCLGIMIRCIFRVIEFSQGYDGTLRTTEWYFYVFDTLPLVLAIIVWVFIWPSKYFGIDPTNHGGTGMATLGSGAMSGYEQGHAHGRHGIHGSGERLNGKDVGMTEEEVGMVGPSGGYARR